MGPMLFQQNPQFIWTVIASMVVGNIMLLILNLPLVGLWARLCLIPFKFLAPVVLAVSLVGVYSLRNTMFDVWVTIFFGVIGFIMKKAYWPIAPLILGFILGDLIEGADKHGVQRVRPRHLRCRTHGPTESMFVSKSPDNKPRISDSH